MLRRKTQFIWTKKVTIQYVRWRVKPIIIRPNRRTIQYVRACGT